MRIIVVGFVLSGLSWLFAAGACADDFEGGDPAATGGAGGAAGGAPLADAGSVYGLALVNPACGTGDGGTVSNECIDCTRSECAAELESCFDDTWQTTLVGGVCEEFGSCVDACECGNNECFQACLSYLESSTEDPCRSCILTLIGCEQANCATACDDEIEPDAGHGDDAGSG